MKTTCDFLDAVKALHSLPSDYALAKKIGIQQSAVSNYRSKRSYMDDATAIRVAALLEIDAAIVFAAVHRERAKAPAEQAVWESILEKLGGAAAVVLLGLGTLMPAPPAYAFGTSPADLSAQSNVYYVQSRRRKKKTAFSTAVDLFKAATQQTKKRR